MIGEAHKRALFTAVSCVVLAAAAGLPAAAQAQTAQAQAAQAQAAQAKPAGQLEEVVVTARRTTERLQDVPVAVTALSQQKLEELRVTTVQDLNKLAPGLTVDACSAGRDCNRPAIRGYGAQFTGTVTE